MSKKDTSQHHPPPPELREDPELLLELQRQAPTWIAKGAYKDSRNKLKLFQRSWLREGL